MGWGLRFDEVLSSYSAPKAAPSLTQDAGKPLAMATASPFPPFPEMTLFKGQASLCWKRGALREEDVAEAVYRSLCAAERWPLGLPRQ